MIYKFKDEKNLNSLEVSVLDKKQALITTKDGGGNGLVFALDSVQLYNLIGALHSIQTNIKKEVYND